MKIHILQPDLANKIAAGEVVQRPASVVKELAENSLDAGATRIEVIVKDAGKSLIQVADDGEGMSDEDALLAFQRHATSKISSAGDLENIRTLGFRGEALASIAAVAQVELTTRTADQDVATFVRVEGNEVKERSKSARPRGTSVIARNLFYNTPARRNFLKTRQTELKNITDVVTRLAMASPGIEWRYVCDDEVLLDLKPSPWIERLAGLFGRKAAEACIAVKESTEFLSVEGFIGRPDFSRKSRNDQFFYLNGRFILSRMLGHAVFQAYEHLMIHGTYPFAVLFLTIDPRHVDVNVHPSKLEVKFERESDIYRFVLSVVRKSLAQHDLVPSMGFRGQEGAPSGDARFSFQAPDAPSGGGWPGAPDWSSSHVFPFEQKPAPAAVPGGASPLILNFEEMFQRRQSEVPGESVVPPVGRIIQHVPSTVESASAGEGRAVWQVHNKYILAQVRNGVMIVDQHAAHERILYERAVANFENSLPTTQQLLFPETVELSAGDYSLAKELLPNLLRIGFDMKLFGKNTVVIEGIPADVRIGGERHILQEILDEYRANEHASGNEVRDALAKSFACKAAIKAGDRLTLGEMVALIEHLFLTKMPYVCPHGRPVVVKIPLEELDRRFGRT